MQIPIALERCDELQEHNTAEQKATVYQLIFRPTPCMVIITIMRPPND